MTNTDTLLIPITFINAKASLISLPFSHADACLAGILLQKAIPQRSAQGMGLAAAAAASLSKVPPLSDWPEQ